MDAGAAANRPGRPTDGWSTGVAHPTRANASEAASFAAMWCTEGRGRRRRKNFDGHGRWRRNPMGFIGNEMSFMARSMLVSVVGAASRVVSEPSSFRRDSVALDSSLHRLQLGPAGLAERPERIRVFRL